MDPYIGKFLDDRYEILDVLGTGGMAVVYRAYCHRLNRYVAVKILKSELASDQDLRRRFHDESQAVAMLSHPNIVAVYDVSQVDDCEFIVMELIDGITLKQYMVKRGGCLNWREALHFITQIMQGLKHAHSRGIIHRDIKPQNVMVLRDGSVKVTDFGIARSTTSQATMTQEAIGSVHYISPEQARGSHIDARSDIYSAGVVLYEMLTGRLPYEGDNPVSVAIQHINSIPIAPRELNPAVPLGMEQITMKAMASMADRRYVNAEEMLMDLEDFRKNPEIDFGYSAPGVVMPEADEPTMVRKGASGFIDDISDADATVRKPIYRRPPARFEREEEPYPEENDDYDDYDPDEKKKNRLFIGITAGIAALLVILFVVLWFSVFRGMLAKDPTYTVPDFVGDTVEEAQAKLDADEELKAHFAITVGEYAPSEEHEQGVILQQSPEAERSVQEDKTVITLTVSSGPAVVEPEEFLLESYTDQDYRLVKSKLEQLGIRTDCKPEYHDTVAEGCVIRTDPAAGTSLKAGDTVTIYYSQGPEDTTVNMIQLLNLTERDARNAISAMELTISAVDTEYSDEYEEGRVCYQSIPKDTRVEKGTAVEIHISLGPKPVEPQEPDVPDVPSVETKDIIVNLPPDRTEDCIVEITVNNSIICKETIPPSEVEKTVTYEGSIITITVKVDNEPYEDYEIVNRQ